MKLNKKILIIIVIIVVVFCLIVGIILKKSSQEDNKTSEEEIEEVNEEISNQEESTTQTKTITDWNFWFNSVEWPDKKTDFNGLGLFQNALEVPFEITGIDNICDYYKITNDRDVSYVTSISELTQRTDLYVEGEASISIKLESEESYGIDSISISNPNENDVSYKELFEEDCWVIMLNTNSKNLGIEDKYSKDYFYSSGIDDEFFDKLLEKYGTPDRIDIISEWSDNITSLDDSIGDNSKGQADVVYYLVYDLGNETLIICIHDMDFFSNGTSTKVCMYMRYVSKNKEESLTVYDQKVINGMKYRLVKYC